MSARIVRRDSAGVDGMPDTMPALLKRIYAGRGVRDPAGLELGLDRLIPIRELGSIDAAVALLIKHFHSGGRITVIGDFDANPSPGELGFTITAAAGKVAAGKW